MKKLLHLLKSNISGSVFSLKQKSLIKIGFTYIEAQFMRLLLQFYKSFIVTGLFVFGAICTQAQTNLGDPMLEAGTGNRGANNIEAWDKFTTSMPYRITNFFLYQNLPNATGTMHVGLYTDVSGPSALVSGSDGGAITLSSGTGWINYNVTPFNLAAGTYWIAFTFSAASPKMTGSGWNRKAATGTQYYKLSVGYAALPGSWPGGSSNTTNGPISMYFQTCTPPTVSAGSAFTKTCTANASGATIGEAAQAGNTYSWSPTTGLSSSTASNPTANPSTTTTYTVTKTTTASGCTNTASVTVTVNNTSPTVSAGSPFTKTCTANASGATIGEAAQAGNTYLWSPTTGLSSSTVSNPTANPSTTTPYTVTKTTTATGCTNTASVTVTVNNTPPTVSAGSPFTKTCTANASGATIGEAAQAGNTYLWSPTTGLSSSTVSNPTANPSTTTPYTVTKTTTATGCTNTASVTVTVNNTPPTVSAGSPFTKTCSANTSGATIGEANDATATYSWSPTTDLSSSTVSNPTANPSTTTTYTVTKTTTANGCTNTASVTVTVNTTPPAIYDVTGGGTRCSNGSGLSVDLSGSQTGVNYQLFNGASPVGTPLAGTGSGISFTATNAGTYTVVATDATTSCTSNMTGSATIIVNAAPTVTFTKVFASSCNGGTDGSISVAASGGTSPYTYSWTGVGGFTASTPDITGLALGDYTVVVTDNNVCSTTIPDITIKLAPAPSVGISSQTNPGCSFNDGTITAYRIGGVNDGITAIQYNLNNGTTTTPYQNSNVFTGLPAGSYTVTVQDSKICTGVSPTVVLSQSAPLSFTSNGYNTNVSACGGGSDGSTTVTVTGGVLPYHYILDGVEKQSSSLQTYTIGGLQPNIIYNVMVTDSKGCSISKNVTLTQEAAPTAIIAYKGDVSCIGNNDGFITTGQTDGVPGYTYSKDNGVTYQSSYRFLNLVAGTYNVVVKDSKGCTSTPVSVTINPGTVACPPVPKKDNTIESVVGTPGVNNNANTSLSIQAYPNPFASQFTLNVRGNNKEKVSIIVNDVLGRRWYQAQGNANQQYKVGGSLKKGIYFVQVMQGNNVQTIKIVKE